MTDTGVEITAGLGGFLAVFFLAILLILLGWDLSRRLRRLKHQEEVRVELDAEERAERERAAGPRAEDGGTDPDGTDPDRTDGR